MSVQSSMPLTLEIWLNGKPISIEKNMSLLEVLDQFGDDNQDFALAINQFFIPKSNYSQVSLCDGDKIEIISPMQGG